MYQRKVDIEAAPMEGETVLYHPDTRKFCVLNDTAAYLWTLLEQPRSEAQLCEGLLGAFDGVDAEAVRQDVRSTLEEFEALQLTTRV